MWFPAPLFPRSSLSDAVALPGMEVMRFGASLTFANKDVFRRAVIKIVEKSDNERRRAETNGGPEKPPIQVCTQQPCESRGIPQS